jgi:DNA-binding MarR family transcriptional regulator
MPKSDFEERDNFFSDGDEYQDLYLLFARARYLIFRARERELQRYGLTPEQSQVLFVTQALKNKATPAAISRLLLRQPHTVSAIVDRMAKKGLIKKSKDLERRNMVRVTLTDKGKEAYELTTKRGPIHRILGTLNRDERKEFHVYLERVLAKSREELGMDRDELPPSD